MAEDATIGRAKTILVFGDGGAIVALTTDIVARGFPVRKRTPPRFTGTAVFDSQLQRHVADVILPLVDHIGDLLRAPKCRFEISAVNVGAASRMDRGFLMSGFSADLPIFLALISARLQMPVPAGVASTGHIASPEDIRWVRHLPAKLKAASACDEVTMFLCPATEGDQSLDVLTPRQKDEAQAAIANTKERLRIVQVARLDQLVKAVFPLDAIAMAGLLSGFHGITMRKRDMVNNGSAVAEYLSQDSERRFWAVLEDAMLKGRVERTRVILGAYTAHFISRRRYPPRLGHRLRALLLSLPPLTRKDVLSSPAISIATCIGLSQFATEADYPDVPVLFNTSNADVRALTCSPSSPEEQPPTTHIDDLLSEVLSATSEDTLTKTAYLPIDTARASYAMDSIIVSREDFAPAVDAFCTHLCRHLGELDAPAKADSHTRTLLDRAFADKGGHQAALAEAMEGTRGGMRYVLDQMTDRRRREARADHLTYVLRQTLGTLDEKGRSAFVSALFRRLNAFLPPDIDVNTPERYAKDVVTLVQAMTDSMDRMKLVIRSI